MGLAVNQMDNEPALYLTPIPEKETQASPPSVGSWYWKQSIILLVSFFLSLRKKNKIKNLFFFFYVESSSNGCKWLTTTKRIVGKSIEHITK